MTLEFLNEEEALYTYYQIDGSLSEESTKSTCAYSIEKNDKKTYYVKFFRGRILDPHGIDSNKLNSHLAEYRKVSDTVFGYYSDYLQTRKGELLLRAERSFIDV